MWLTLAYDLLQALYLNQLNQSQILPSITHCSSQSFLLPFFQLINLDEVSSLLSYVTTSSRTTVVCVSFFDIFAVVVVAAFG